MVPFLALGNATIGQEQIPVDGLNLTQISYENNSYYVWEGYLEVIDEYEEGYIKIYQDLPAIKANLKGTIMEINGQKIASHEDISNELINKTPGDSINIVTKDDDENLNYDLILGEDYNQEGRAVMGIGVLVPQTKGLRGFMFNIMNSFRNPTLDYEPIRNADFTNFIYYFLWWMILVNFGVALFNILPVGITDGGRYWYLTVLAITKNEKFAMWSYKAVTIAILGIFTLLMVFWGFGIV